MCGVHPNARSIGTSFGNLHHSQVRKIGNCTIRNRETSQFQTYIDEVKSQSPEAIAHLLDCMRADTELAAATAQRGLYDGGVVTIKWCQLVLGDGEFTVVDYPPGPVTSPATTPPIMTTPVAGDHIIPTDTESVAGVQGVSALVPFEVTDE